MGDGERKETPKRAPRRGACADVVTVDCGGWCCAIGPAPGAIVDGFKIVNSYLNRIKVYPDAPDCIIRNCVIEAGTMGPRSAASGVTLEQVSSYIKQVQATRYISTI